ncbi:MAG: hypothetical protein CK530_03265 [Planctomycetaceae bacterium]|nr:MAG: hypothetical protein CK530_13410 [Planctomycetaceae bacterium]PHY03024.1 MAG: hypothetical protein CK530_03265 [Planctomycetaceae bacterium]
MAQEPIEPMVMNQKHQQQKSEVQTQMAYTRQAEACLIGLLAAAVSFCALQASGEQPYSIVAQSNETTAATGRLPLAKRIIASGLPILIPARAESMAVQSEPLKTAEASEATPFAPLPPEPLPVPPTVEVEQPADTMRQVLLKRVKVALAGMPRPVGSASPPAHFTAFEAALVEEPAVEEPAAAVETAVTLEDAPAYQTQHDADMLIETHGPSAEVPAWLEFDVRESRSIVKEGERVVMRIAVRNVGGAPAEGLTTRLFFAEGVEPIHAMGQAAVVSPGEVQFQTLDSLAPGSSVHLLVTAIGTHPGNVVYRGELQCRQLSGSLAREGSVTVSPRDPQ